MKPQRKPNNPFLLSGYHSPPYFCDRSEELLWLQEQIRNERNIVLHAPRRMGKSALIRHLFYQLEQKGESSTVFVDLLGTTSLRSANERIAKSLLTRFGNLNKGIMPSMLRFLGSLGATVSMDQMTGVPQISIAAGATNPSSESFEAIGEFLKASKKPVIICLDEFQEITNYPEKEAEALFRSWTQEYPMIRFIFSGSHQHLIRKIFSEQSRPFYNSAQHMALGAIAADDYAAFIIDHFKNASKDLEPAIIEQLMAWAKGQTYYVQVICNKLFGGRQRDEDRLHFLYKELLEQEIPIFSTYQRLLTSFQWQVLVAIASDDTVQNPLSKAFIQKHTLGAASSVSTALKKLVDTQLVVFDKGYYVQDTLLMRWLQTL